MATAPFKRNAEGSKVGLVYELIDPRNGQCRYVGCTTRVEDRKKYHTTLGWAFGTNVEYDRWRQELYECRLVPVFKVIEEDVAMLELREREQFWCRARAEGGCRLVNKPAGKITRSDLFPASDAMLCCDFAEEILAVIALIKERCDTNRIPTRASKQLLAMMRAAESFKIAMGK
jgi:hypothetical protein